MWMEDNTDLVMGSAGLNKSPDIEDDTETMRISSREGVKVKVGRGSTHTTVGVRVRVHVGRGMLHVT